jgi:UDP-N-acetylglucosamine 2-epimerase (non-hydrolysing)
MPPLDFMTLEKNAKLIITDSGGVQEEACFFGVPCITLRRNTERPETIAIGANRIIDLDFVDRKGFTQQVVDTLRSPARWEHPYGTDASKKIVDVLLSDLKLEKGKEGKADGEETSGEGIEEDGIFDRR